MKNFWRELPFPFTVLAPMDGVTDPVFRQIIVKTGKPDVMFTEFVSCDGLLSIGGMRVSEHLRFSDTERPIVAQLWGSDPKHFFEAALRMRTMGFDGIDINLGCPVKAVIKTGSGAALMQNPKRTAEILDAIRQAVPDIPLSVKTRIGYKDIEVGEWIGFLLRQHPAAISIHLRTVRDLSTGTGHWEFVPEILRLRKEISPSTRIVVNGNIRNLIDVDALHRQFGCDGYMIGRGILANPWAFNRSVPVEKITPQERLDMYLEHIRLFEELYGGKRNGAEIKKFCPAYTHTLPDASQFRNTLMKSSTIGEFKIVINEFRARLTLPQEEEILPL